MSRSAFANHPSIKSSSDYLFDGLALEEIYGSRGFAKNMDRSLNDLLRFYNQYYKDAEENKKTEEDSPKNETKL